VADVVVVDDWEILHEEDRRGWIHGMLGYGTNANREGDAVLQKLALFQDFLAYNTEVSRIVC
jgi:hypothetical protein